MVMGVVCGCGGGTGTDGLDRKIYIDVARLLEPGIRRQSATLKEGCQPAVRLFNLLISIHEPIGGAYRRGRNASLAKLY